jgi:hypothetical protein
MDASKAILMVLTAAISLLDIATNINPTTEEVDLSFCMSLCCVANLATRACKQLE